MAQALDLSDNQIHANGCMHLGPGLGQTSDVFAFSDEEGPFGAVDLAAVCPAVKRGQNVDSFEVHC